MKKFWYQWFYLTDPKKVWGLPFAVLLLLVGLLAVNLLWVGHEDPDAAVSTQTEKGARKQRDLQPSAAPLPSRPLPKKPDLALWSSRIVEIKPGVWQVVDRGKTYTQRNLPHVIAVMQGRRLVVPVDSISPGHFRFDQIGESQLSFSRADKKQFSHLSFDRFRKYRYALQITSLDETQASAALLLAAKLTEAGYYAYLYRSKQPRPVKGEQRYFYQLRVGYFASENELTVLSKKLKAEFQDEPLLQEKFWPVLPNYEEVNQGLVDFRVQRSQPWVVHLGAFGVLENGLKSLAIAGPYFDFLYLTQVQRKGKMWYLLKAGYFAKRATGFTVLEKLRKETSLRFKGASMSRLRYKLVTAPGS